MITVEGLNKTFKVAKRSAGFKAAGKSTTIKVMSGILLPDSGKCDILGHTPWNNRASMFVNTLIIMLFHQ